MENGAGQLWSYYIRYIGASGMVGAISIGSIICIVTAMAGDTSQDLKTGFILGATPKKQQIGEIIGAVVSAIAIGGVLILLDKAWGFGTTELAACVAFFAMNNKVEEEASNKDSEKTKSIPAASGEVWKLYISTH